MDLINNSYQQVQEGQMRTNSVMNANKAVQEHNNNVATQIATLKGQQETAGTVESTKDAIGGMWTMGKIPSQVTALQDHVAKGGTLFSNPTSEAQAGAEAEAGVSADAKLGKLTDVGDGIVESAGEEGGELLGTAGKFAKGVGVLGSVATAGLDIYKDVDSLEHGGGIAGDNWAEKTANVLQIGGALADIGGTVFPPLALFGTATDLIGAGIGEVGELLDKGKQTVDDAKLQAQNTETQVAQQVQEPVTIGRVQ
jgi:hypothetical protein